MPFPLPVQVRIALAGAGVLLASDGFLTTVLNKYSVMEQWMEFALQVLVAAMLLFGGAQIMPKWLSFCCVTHIAGLLLGNVPAAVKG